MSHNYDPAKGADSPNWSEDVAEMKECDMNKAGPGGRTTNIENDERGILETGLRGVISRHTYAELGCDHDSYKQGIYTTNSVGDRD